MKMQKILVFGLVSILVISGITIVVVSGYKKDVNDGSIKDEEKNAFESYDGKSLIETKEDDKSITKIKSFKSELNYDTHDPIKIDNNNDLAAHAMSGGGTKSDPYIIENYEINGSAVRECIYIGNTTDHFILRNCSFHHSNQYGLNLFNVENGIIYNNEITDNLEGIRVNSSSENCFSKNKILSNHWYGITLSDTNDNIISNNTVIDNRFGISLFSSDYNMIKYNNFSKHYRDGIYLSDCSQNDITNNFISENGYNGIKLSESSSNNIVNNEVLRNDFGIAIKSSSDRNTIKDNDITNSSYSDGIHLSKSDENIIENNVISKNDGDGISLYEANITKIENNTVTSNKEGGSFLMNGVSGILIYGCRDTTLRFNEMVNNSVVLKGNKEVEWNSHVIDTSNTVNDKPVRYLKDKTDVTVSSDAGQVILACCTDMTVENQDVSKTTIPIELGFTDSSLIKGNYLEDSTNGIYLYASSENTVTNNYAVSNDQCGILLGDASINNEIDSNDVIENDLGGIRLDKTLKNTISNNLCLNNSGGGIELYTTQGVELKNNILVNNGVTLGGWELKNWNTHSIDTSNTINGKPIQYWKNQDSGTVPQNAGQVILVNCTDVAVKDQILNNSGIGLQLAFCGEGLVIKNNVMSSNTWQGINIYNCLSGDIINNTITDNKYGLVVEKTNNTLIKDNLIASNRYTGIDIAFSHNNSLYENTILKNKKQVELYRCNNHWYEESLQVGNYWGGYKGTDSDGDGIGDDPYTVYESIYRFIEDEYPLMEGTRKIDGYIPRKPIRIDSDSDFDQAHGVVDGDGTETDPYIIEGYSLNGSDYGYCIYVGNTSAEFIVRDCHLHDAEGDNSEFRKNTGVYLYRTANGIVRYNDISSNEWDGVYVFESHNNSVSSNDVKDNGADGINLYESEYNMVYSNTVKNNEDNGIEIYHFSDKNTIMMNTVSNNGEHGFRLELSGHNSMVYNRAYDNVKDGVNLYYSSSNWITGMVSEGSGRHGLHIFLSEDNKVTKSTISESLVNGIYLNLSSSNNEISKNVIKSNERGIYLNSSNVGSCKENRIHNNTIMSNKIGMYFPSTSENNTMYHNDFLGNTEQAYDDGTGNEWFNVTLEEGNFWTDYEGTDSDGDGIGDIPYDINGDSQSKDEYPLVEPWREDKTDPVADAGENKTVGKGVEFTLDGSGSTDDVGIVSYKWELGDGVNKTGENISYSYDDLGEHAVVLTVTDQAGNTDNDTVIVDVVTSELVVNALQVPETGIIGKEVTMTASVENIGGASLEDDIYIDGESAETFTLQPGESKDITVDYVFDYTGSYTISVGEEETTITINEILVINDVSLDKDTVNVGGNVTIESNITNNDDSVHAVEITVDGESVHTWNVESGVSGEIFIYEHTFDESGTFEVMVGDNTAGEVEVKEPGDPIADAGDDKTVDVGEEFSLDASSSSDDEKITSYEWNLGDGATKSGETITYTYNSEGTYTVELTITDESGNTDTDSIEMTVEKSGGGGGSSDDSGSEDGLSMITIGAIIVVIGVISVIAVFMYKKD